MRTPRDSTLACGFRLRPPRLTGRSAELLHNFRYSHSAWKRRRPSLGNCTYILALFRRLLYQQQVICICRGRGMSGQTGSAARGATPTVDGCHRQGCSILFTLPPGESRSEGGIKGDAPHDGAGTSSPSRPSPFGLRMAPTMPEGVRQVHLGVQQCLARFPHLLGDSGGCSGEAFGSHTG